MTDSPHPLCRICLTAENRSFYDLSPYALLMQDLGGISVQDSDGFPQWLCMECVVLLKKCARFKQKMLRAHSVLYEYLNRCAPFSIDGTDVELLKYASPQLALTDTLACHFSKSRMGFHTVLQHKNTNKQKLKFEPERVPYVLSTSLEVAAFKDEPDFSDYEDNIPLDEYKHTIDKFTEEDLSALLKDGDQSQVKTEEAEVLNEDFRKKKKRRHKDKEKKGDKKKRKTTKDTTTKLPKSIEKPPKLPKPPKDRDVDPAKIKVIHLDPEEQIAEMRIESEKEGICKLKFKCKLCYKGFNYQEKLDNHMSKHSPSRGKYMCKLCHMYLPTPNSYNVHMFIHTRRYECLKCGRRMTDRQSIVDHYRSQHEGLATYYTCHYCGKVSSNNKTHRGHLRNHHGAQRPKCDLCGKTFVNKDSLTEHILIHQGIKNYECIKCGKTFRTKTQLKHHQLKHTDVREFYCVECDTRFKSAHSLKQHLLKSAKHRDSQSLQFQCRTCLKRFETATLLTRHESIQHLGERLYSCSTCPARLATAAGLDKHERRHRDNKPLDKVYCCHTCGRTFSRLSVLHAHTRTHSGARPHACARCPRAFTQRAALVTHVKLVHLHLKRTDKVKPEIINAIPTFPDTETPRTQFVSKQHTTSLQDEKRSQHNLKLLENCPKLTSVYKIDENQRDMLENRDLVPTNSNNMVPSANNMVPSTNNMVPSTNNMAQSCNNMAQSTNNIDQTKMPIQSKLVLHNEKLTPLGIKMDARVYSDNCKETRVDSKLSQDGKGFSQRSGEPKVELFEEDWRDNGSNQVYYYIQNNII